MGEAGLTTRYCIIADEVGGLMGVGVRGSLGSLDFGERGGLVDYRGPRLEKIK